MPIQRNTPRVPAGNPEGGEIISHEQQQLEGQAYRQSTVVAIPADGPVPTIVHLPAHSEKSQDALVIEQGTYDENGVSVSTNIYSVPTWPAK